MMIRTAGGPGLVSPFDYNERRTPRFTRTTWIAVAVVAVGHIGAGAALYHQRFELTPPIETPAPPPTIIELVKPEPKPKEPLPAPAAPQAPNTLMNEPPTPAIADTVVEIIQGESVTEGTTLSALVQSPEPIEGSPTATDQPRPPAVITNPRWERRPSATQLMRAYPERALRAGVGGLVTVNCLVQPNGRVADCNLVGETPGAYGFGRAAQGLTRHFQISPRTVDGAAVGSRVNIGIRFDPPPAN